MDKLDLAPEELQVLEKMAADPRHQLVLEGRPSARTPLHRTLTELLLLGLIDVDETITNPETFVLTPEGLEILQSHEG